MKAKLIIGMLLTLPYFSCEEVVIIDLNQTETQLVIDGLLTNQYKIHEVKLSQSIDFYGINIPPVVDALVAVGDGAGNFYNYTHNPEGYDSLNGVYFSDFEYEGIIGQNYTLTVQYEGQSYVATDTLRRVTSIDSLAVKVDPFASGDPDSQGEIYQVVLYAQEPLATKDFYYFRFYRDQQLASGDNVYAFDDEALSGSLDGLPSPILFKEGELAGVEVYSLTRQQYVYFIDLANILNNDGGMFSPPPANPRNNISNGALGLWQVSAVSIDSIIVVP